MNRAFEWFSRLNLVQKVLAVLFAALLLWSLAYILTGAFLYLSSGGQSSSPVEEGAAPNTASPGSSSASARPQDPGVELTLTSARWEGEKAVVEGTWKGDISVSSVHCDLFEGGASEKATRWWDRSVGTQMDWSRRTFTQEFVAAEGSGESLDPEASYSVMCVGSFSSSWSTGAQAQVEGEPPG